MTPAPAAAPAVAPQQTAAPQAMNQRVAASIASDPNATQAQRDEALRWLRSLSRDEQIAVGADSLVEQLVESGQAAGEREAAAQARAEFESGVAEQGQIIADYLVQGFDQRGEPILNPAVATAAGRSISETLGTAGYQQYVGAINFIKNNLTFDRLLSLKDQGATFGALSEGELRQIASSVSTLNVEDPLGTLNELRRLERTYGISFGLAPQQAPTRRPNARTTWED